MCVCGVGIYSRLGTVSVWKLGSHTKQFLQLYVIYIRIMRSTYRLYMCIICIIYVHPSCAYCTHVSFHFQLWQ